MGLIRSRRYGCSRLSLVRSELKSLVSNPDFRQVPTRNNGSKLQIQTSISTLGDLSGIPLTDELVRLLALWMLFDHEELTNGLDI